MKKKFLLSLVIVMMSVNFSVYAQGSYNDCKDKWSQAKYLLTHETDQWRSLHGGDLETIESDTYTIHIKPNATESERDVWLRLRIRLDGSMRLEDIVDDDYGEEVEDVASFVEAIRAGTARKQAAIDAAKAKEREERLEQARLREEQANKRSFSYPGGSFSKPD